MDEKTRRQLERQAIERQEKERLARQQKEEADRRRRDEDHKRYLMQQMAVEKQKQAQKDEEIRIAKKNDDLVKELERKKWEQQNKGR